jgi:hypothetical protein
MFPHAFAYDPTAARLPFAALDMRGKARFRVLTGFPVFKLLQSLQGEKTRQIVTKPWQALL